MRFGFVVSGRPYQPQMRLMRRPLDLMIATPGRLNDLIDNNKADFSKLEMLIVDDLTTIYHKNMQNLLNKILVQTGDDCPTVAFIRDDKEVTPYVRGLFPEAEEIKIIEEDNNKGSQKKKHKQQVVNKNHNNKSAKKLPSKKIQKKIELPNISHVVHVADDYTHKIALMDYLLDEFEGESVIIYTSTLKSAEKLLDNLANHGHEAELARNLSAEDIQSVAHATLLVSDQCRGNIVINGDRRLLHFELPYNISKYQARLDGKLLKENDSAIILADGRDYNSLKTIEKMMGKGLEQQVVPGLETLKPFVSQGPASGKQRVNKSKPLGPKQNNKKRHQDNKAKNKRHPRKGPNGRLDGVLGQHKRNPLHHKGQNSLGNDNWQSDFAEPKERSVKAKRVVIRYKESKKSLLK
jgi:superfamily II DNA/RNA helicase